MCLAVRRQNARRMKVRVWAGKSKSGAGEQPEQLGMCPYVKHLLQFIDQYIAETGQHNIDMRLVAAWAISKGLWHPQPEGKIKRLARDLSRAGRTDTIPPPPDNLEEDDGDSTDLPKQG